jgi:adenylate cyclase
METLTRAIRTRRLDRVAIGYAVVGWVLVQAASIALPAFDAPLWVLRAFIIFVLLGFPLSLAIAWFAVPHIDAKRTGRGRLKHTHVAFGLVAAVVVFFAGDLAYLLSRVTIGNAPPADIAVPQIARNSIAVLPFVNMSGDPAKEYFSDGISEELLNDLANIPALLVAARTSSFAFKGKNENIKDIARILAVRSVLEGSVRASGQHLRITTQLIDADEGYDLWSATYDRDLTDVLAVQDEIAQAITRALTHRLLPAPRPAQNPKGRPIDPEAYRKYLLGKHELAPRTDAGGHAALALFKDVTRLAPNFAEGFAALARAEINVAEYHSERTDLIPAAHEAISQALALDPSNIRARSSHLDLALHELDWQAAVDDAHVMQSINANSAEVLHEMFRYYQFLGFPDLAQKAATDAAKLDPLSFVDRLNVVAALLHNGRYADAERATDTAFALDRDNPLILSMLCTAAVHQSELNVAHSAEAKLIAAHDSNNAQFCSSQLAFAEGRRADAKKTLDALAKTYLHGGPSASEIAEFYAVIGDYKDAGHWLEKASTLKEYLLVLFPYEKIVPPAFFRDAAWKSVSRSAMLVDWKKVHDRVVAEMASQGQTG